MSSSGTTSGDVLVIGGGLAGLSTALELSRRGAKVMVLNRDASESASMAAGGMLAPQAERLPAGGWVGGAGQGCLQRSAAVRCCTCAAEGLICG